MKNNKDVERSVIINKLIDTYGFEKYLEIGVDLGNNFLKVNCKNKECVDPFVKSLNYEGNKDIYMLNERDSVIYDYIEKHILTYKMYSDDFFENTNIVLTGHLDPIVVNDEKVNELRIKVANLVTDIDSSFSIHDFRMVEGPNNTNLIFDVAVPYECTLCDKDIKEMLDIKIKKIGDNYKLVVKIEKQTL